MTTLEQSVERTIDLLRIVLSGSAYAEPIRREMADIEHQDQQRRLFRDGKHPLTGETWADYQAVCDKSRDGTHPVTGETYEVSRAKYPNA